MRQQEGIDDDDQLNRGDHKEVDHDGASHEEGSHDHQEDLDKEEERYKRIAGCITVTYSVTVRFAALSRQAQHFRRGRT